MEAVSNDSLHDFRSSEHYTSMALRCQGGNSGVGAEIPGAHNAARLRNARNQCNIQNSVFLLMHVDERIFFQKCVHISTFWPAMLAPWLLFGR